MTDDARWPKPPKLPRPDDFHDPVLPRGLRVAMLLALRLASTHLGAPARCRKKACQGGRCHMVIEPGGDGVCRGGLNPEVVKLAALLLYFGELGKKLGIDA